MALTDEKMQDQVIDLNIDAIKKTRFRINGDPDSVIELNLSDLNIKERLEEGIDRLEEEIAKISKLPDDENLSGAMKQIDKVMCDWMDYIFDSPISAVFSKGGAMFDPIDGVFRYEHILDTLTKLYTDNLNSEYKKLKARVQKHTDKYTKKTSTKSKKS